MTSPTREERQRVLSALNHAALDEYPWAQDARAAANKVIDALHEAEGRADRAEKERDEAADRWAAEHDRANRVEEERDYWKQAAEGAEQARVLTQNAADILEKERDGHAAQFASVFKRLTVVEKERDEAREQRDFATDNMTDAFAETEALRTRLTQAEEQRERLKEALVDALDVLEQFGMRRPATRALLESMLPTPEQVRGILNQTHPDQEGKPEPLFQPACERCGGSGKAPPSEAEEPGLD